MANTIPLESVPAPVIQFNNHAYLENGQYAPRTLNVPCGINALVDDQQWWAIPVKDEGIVNEDFLQMVPAINGNVSQPTIDSIQVTRVRDKYQPHFTWWVACTLEEYYASCQVCCDDTPVPIPDPTLPVIIPCQTLCETNSDGDLFAIFGYPADIGNYTGYAQYNGEVLPTQTASSIALLLIAINIHWTNIGSPSVNFQWAASNGILTAIGGNIDDSLCVLITSQS